MLKFLLIFLTTCILPLAILIEVLHHLYMQFPRLIKKISLLAALSGSLYIFLSHTGFCFDEMRYFSDQEKLRAMKSAFAERAIKQRQEFTSGQHRYLPFKDMDEFKALNPDFFADNSNCCKILYAHESMPGFWDRINGWSKIKVQIGYRQKTEPINGLAVDTQKNYFQYRLRGGISHVRNCPRR